MLNLFQHPTIRLAWTLKQVQGDIVCVLGMKGYDGVTRAHDHVHMHVRLNYDQPHSL